MIPTDGHQKPDCRPPGVEAVSNISPTKLTAPRCHRVMESCYDNFLAASVTRH